MAERAVTTDKDGPVAVVTGAAGALGRAIGDALRTRGHFVVGIDRVVPDDAASNRFHACDLNDLDALEPLMARIERESGSVTVLVNCAAHVSGCTIEHLTTADILRTLSVNVAAVLLLSRAAAEAMATRGRGAIVNIASIAGQRGSSQVDYGASKAAVISLTRSLGRHYALRGVRINAVAPGLVDAGMGNRLPPGVRGALVEATPLRRGARVDEIASVVAFLASDAASYVIGETIGVDGGI